MVILRVHGRKEETLKTEFCENILNEGRTDTSDLTACQLFGVKGDEILAHNLQDKEFEAKYSWNREMRRTARTDVPLAKATYDEEEQRQQRDRLHFLQNQTKLAEQDAELARQYDREEQLAKQQDKLRQEVRDQELAKRIQVMEIQEQGRPKVKRSRDDDNSQHGQHVMLGGSVIRMSSFSGFHIDPTTGAAGDDGLEEEERKQLMMMQDEELALALQEHEEMRALRLGRSHARTTRSTSDEHVTQQPVVIQAQPERFQSTGVPRRPSVVQPVLTSRGCDQVDGFSHPPSPPPPLVARQHPPRSQGPPARPPAPHAPVQQVRPDDAYMNPIRSRNSNDVNGKTVTVVTSVGKSEFFRTIPATEARSLESKHQQQTVRMAPTNHQSSSSAENNKTNFAQSNRKDSTRKASKRM